MIPASPPTILVVDDTPVNLILIQCILRAEGFKTLTADNGEMARTLCSSEQPDLILLDVMMPGESGFETCGKLKSNSATAEIPIIFLSALDDVDSKVAGLRTGGVDYITKPVHKEEVLARVRVHLRLRNNNLAMIREHRELLDQLRDAQQAILVHPKSLPEAGFAIYYKPLEEAGGDFYDVIPISPNVFGYFVADISGHGVSAAFLTSAVKALLRQYTGLVFTPEDTLRRVDSVMRQILGEEQYLTAVYARLNRTTGLLSVISAGHPPMILVDSSGRAQVVRMDSDPLGIFSSAVLTRTDLRVSTGDRFFLYTDGLIESDPGGGREAGLVKLVDACVRHRSVPLDQAVGAITQELRPNANAVGDDLLLLAVEIRL